MKTDNSNTLLSSTHFLLFALFPILFAYACQRTEATTQELLNLKGLKATPNPSVSSFQALLISYTDTVSLGCQRVNSKELAQQPCLANPTQLAPWQTEIPFGSKTRHFKWKVEYMSGTPDCMEHGLMGINGQFPGPTIRARAGDTISVEVTNKLHTEGVVIHWHGITQLGTPIPWADGTASVSQYTINPGETFLYRFKVNKAGSYFYHGHFGMQRSARLCGSLIVDKGDGETEPSHYDGEFNPLLSDSCHQSVHNEEADLSSKPFILQWRKLLNDKELGESKASVHGSGSKTSPSEEDTQDVDKELGESKASVHGSGSKTSPSEEDTQDVDKELGESKASVHGSGSKTSPKAKPGN